MARQTNSNERIELEDIIELSQIAGPNVTLLVPTDPGLQVHTDARIRLKNQISEAHTKLVEGGMRATIANDVLARATKLVDDEKFWNQPLAGLAIYVTPRHFKVFHLPAPPQPLTSVSHSFVVRPLISLLPYPSFHVLALDQKHTRLIRVSGDKQELVHVPTMPESLDEVVGDEYSEKQRQMHAVGGRTRTLSAASHGAGDRGADTKNRIIRFTIAVERAVRQFLGTNGTSLVLAADQPILDMYRNANKYPHLKRNTIVGSPNRKSNADIAKQAREIIDESRARALESKLGEYAALESQFRASDDRDDIQRAAPQGKIDSLFVRANDLLDDANANRLVLETLKRGGHVFEVPAQMMPAKSPLAAIYRF